MNSIKKYLLLSVLLISSVQRMNAMMIGAIAAAAGAVPGIALYINEWWQNEQFRRETAQNFRHVNVRLDTLTTEVTDFRADSKESHKKTQDRLEKFDVDFFDFSNATTETLDGIKTITNVSKEYLDEIRLKNLPEITIKLDDLSQKTDDLSQKTNDLLSKLSLQEKLFPNLITKDDLAVFKDEIIDEMKKQFAPLSRDTNTIANGFNYLRFNYMSVALLAGLNLHNK